MAELINKGVYLNGSLKVDGVTFYTRKGKTIMRSAFSEQPNRRTRKQFVARQRMTHTTSLWKRLRETGEPLFVGGTSSYGRFCTLMRKLPVVFLQKRDYPRGGSLLLPGMPVSDGPLPDIEYGLGEVEGTPALLTSLRLAPGGSLTGRGADLSRGEQLWLYRLRQTVQQVGEAHTPVVRVRLEVLDTSASGMESPFESIALREVDGQMALTGEVFGDETMGWALVRVNEGQASSQKVVTRCTLYGQYLTEEALQRAARSYGGLTEDKAGSLIVA